MRTRNSKPGTTLLLSRKGIRAAPLLAFVWLVLSSVLDESASAKLASARPPTPVVAFTAIRYPDTVDTRGPYVVRLRQLAGVAITEGRVAYSVSTTTGEKVTERQVKLRRAENGKDWFGQIPGQPPGSVITYHYLLSTQSGQVFRHPARNEASYQFRIVALQALSVKLPTVGTDTTGEQPITLRVQATSRPSGEIILRRLSLSSETHDESHISLSILEERNRAGDPKIYVMSGNLPNLQPGQIAEFYFQVRASSKIHVRIPADAPARVYSIKKPVKVLPTLPGDQAFVLDVSSFRNERLIGLRGGGVWMSGPDNKITHWGLGHGLPAATARFVIPDSVSGLFYVGTDHGVVAINPEGDSWVPVSTFYTSAWASELQALTNLGSERRAGPGAISTLDGTVFFQLQGNQLQGRIHPPAAFLQLRADKLSEWKQPPTTTEIVGLSCMNFDAIDGCWLLGGFVSDAVGRLQPVVVRRCGETVEQTLLKPFTAGESQIIPERIVALTRDPLSGELVVALQEVIVNKRERRRDYSVCRLKSSTGDLSLLGSEWMAVGGEVTSLATDWKYGRVFVGTFGKGLLEIQPGIDQRPKNIEGLPPEITVVRVDDNSETLLVGTSRGAFEVFNGGARKLSFGPSGEGSFLADALPMDADQATGRVLLSSYSAGLSYLEREQNGQWHAVKGPDFSQQYPKALFGDAQFTLAGGVCAILYSQGLLKVEDGRSKLFGTAEGIQKANLLRLLVRRSGDIWVAYAPLPFGATAGASIQIIRDDRVVRTINIPNREVATIGQWIEVPERNSVFAATRAGVIEIREDGSLTRLSTDSVSSIARDPHTGEIGVVGTAVQRWDGKRFMPILFRVDHPRWPRGKFQPENPIAIAIGNDGIWYLLFKRGILVLLNREGHFLNVLDAEDGIPPSARRLLAHSETEDIFVGSSGEGLAVVHISRSVR